MAYRADIEIAVRGAAQLTKLQAQINSLSAGIDYINKQALFKGAVVASVANFTDAVSQSERAMRSAAIGTNVQKKSIDLYIQSVAAAEKAEKSLQLAIKTRRRELGIRAPATTAGRATGNRLGGAVSGAVIGGAFPLLFGQGGGAAAGGAIGGLAGGLLGPGGSFAGSLLGTLLGGIAQQGSKIKELASDIGFSAEQTVKLQQAFKLAGQDADKFTAAVQNIRGLGLSLEEQGNAIKLVSVLTETYGGNIVKVSNAFTSALESGKVTQATLNQLTSEGIPIQDALAEKYGVSRNAILAMAKDGQISVQSLADTLVSMGNKGLEAGQKPKTAFEDFQAALGNTATAVSNVASALLTTLSPAINQIIREATLALNILTETINTELLRTRIQKQSGKIIGPEKLKQIETEAMSMASRRFPSQARGRQLAAGPNIISPRAQAEFQIIREQLIRNELQRFGYESGILRAPAATPNAQIQRINAPAQAAPGGGGGGAKPKKDKTAEELQRSLEQGRALAQEFARQVKLLNTTTDIERKRLQIQFDFEDRQKQILELKNAEQRTSLTTQNQEIRRLELIDLQTEALKKQTDEAEKLFDVIIQGYNFGVSREGGTGAGIFGKLSELKQNLDPVKVQVDSIATGATVIGDAFSLAFGEIISGAKSTEQALADTFQQIGDAFINMAVNIIAQQMTMIILGSILKALGLGFNLSGTNALSTGSSPLGGIGGSLNGAGYGGVSGITPIGPSFGGATFPAFFADGGFVTAPTRAVVGEGGQSEYIIPASKMRSAMSRYAAGARGSAVIPAGDDTSSGGGTATMAPAAIDVRYTVERINSVDYVTADQFRAGMAQAAQQGATQGEQRTLRRLQQSRATRSRLGMN